MRGHMHTHAQRGVWRAMRLTAPRAVEGDVDGGEWSSLAEWTSGSHMPSTHSKSSS
jgi:hypothetical protein